jgi:hypothetical protein
VSEILILKTLVSCPPPPGEAVHVIHTEADGTDGENYIMMSFKMYSTLDSARVT